MAFKIIFLPFGRRIRREGEISILELAHLNNIGIESICGGIGDCGKCKVRVKGASVSELTPAEEILLTKEEIIEGFRLACQAIISGDTEVYIPPSSLTQEQKLQIAGEERPVKVDPTVKKFILDLPPPTLSDTRSDLRRIEDTLRQQFNINVTQIDFKLLKGLAKNIRDNNWKICVTMRDKEIIAVEPPKKADVAHGVAIDLGTTKIALYLVDLISGETVDALGIMNPQMAHGEDVISRIRYTVENKKGTDELQSDALKTINESIQKMCEKNGVDLEDVMELTLVGNTAMHHLFLGLPTRQLALIPFVPETTDPLAVKAHKMGFDINPGAYVYLLSPIAGFVGSDHTAMLLSTAIAEKEGNVLGIDIGTNTEVALKTNQGITSCSTASGPAFEGARIKYGMRAAPGAIEAVHIDHQTLEVSFSTIGDKPPVGICGSGILDAISEMLKAEILNAKGKFENRRGVRMGEDGVREFVLAEMGEGGAEDIVVTQQDVVEIQLAKGAIRTGIEILLKDAGLKPADIGEVIIAGAFGTYIDVASALAIGMFPRIPIGRFHQVGNAAGIGVKQVLISKEARSKAEQLAKSVKYLELTAYPDFSRYFAHSLRFPETK
ncbi:MAG: ASKHA domain-containing protein [Actinomycetota bacterium]